MTNSPITPLERRTAWGVVVVGLFALVGGCGVVALAWQGAAALAIGAHVAMTIVLVGLSMLVKSNPPLSAGARSIALWSGLAGAIGAIVALFLHFTSLGRAPEPMAWLETDAKPDEDVEVRTLVQALLDRRTSLSRGADTEPLMDVLLAGDRNARFAALGVIARRYQPEHADALKVALRHADPSVRVLAASAQAQILRRSSGAITAARKAAEADPHDATLWLALATAHQAHVRTALLNDDEVERELAHASDALGRAAACASATPKALSEARAGLAETRSNFGSPAASISAA